MDGVLEGNIRKIVVSIMMSEQGVLKPVDVNVEYSPPRKRSRFTELATRDIKTIRRCPHIKDIQLHDMQDHGIGRLDCDDDLAGEEDSIFNKNAPVGVDVSCASLTPDTRGKQVSLLESTLTKESLDKVSNVDWDNSLSTNKPLVKHPKTNYFDLLSDEVILHILRLLPKTSLADFALCCKRFSTLTKDETLWTRMDVSNRQLSPGELGSILARQVIVLRLSRSEINCDPFLPGCESHFDDFRSRLLYLDLSMVHISIENLLFLFDKCRRLKKLSLENVPLNEDVLRALSENVDLEVLNLALCTGINLEGLKHLLTNCKKIRELNIAWTYLTKTDVQFVSENLPSTMDRLNFSGCRKLMNDDNVRSLVRRCPKLRELDLSDCTILSGDTIQHILQLQELTYVALCRCYLIPYRFLFCLKEIVNLSYLDIHGCCIEGHELEEVRTQLGASVQINKFKFSSIARPTVGMRRSTIWNMRVRD